MSSVVIPGAGSATVPFPKGRRDERRLEGRMLLPRGLPWRRFIGLLCLGALIGVGPGRTFAAFVSSTDSEGSSFSAARIYAGNRSTTAWDVSDAADGSESDESDQRAFVDADYTTTGSWSSSWSTSRYLEFEMNSPLPAGVSLTDAAFDLTYADSDSASNQFCYYFEVRRTSTGAVLGTYGSTTTPISCESSQTMKTVSTPISVVPDTDIANDITIRLFGRHTGSQEARIDAANVSGSHYGLSFKLYSHRFVDAADGSASTTRWGPAVAGDGSNYQSFGSWSSSFSSSRYIKFKFPGYVPPGATVASASIDHSYRSATSGETACWYAEVYNGTTLIGTHGSSGSPISCNSTSSFVSNNVPIPEVDTNGEANNLTVRVYARVTGSENSQHDLVRLNVNYSLGATGCETIGTQTLYSDADTLVDQNAPTTNEGTNVDLKVKARNATEARRTLVGFPLPSIPSGCSLLGATLRMYANSAQGTRTIQTYRAAAPWNESTVTWNDQPGTSGSPVAISHTGTGWKEWSVADLVAAMYAGTNTGFLLKDSVENSGGTTFEQRYGAREGTNDPELVLIFGQAGACSAPGTQTVTSNKDSYVDQSSPSSNDGSSSDLILRSKGTTENVRVLLGFPLPSVPSGCQVGSATLRMNSTQNVGTRTIQVYRAAGAWTENAVTWSNHPSLAGTPGASGNQSGWTSWAVTGLVQELYSGSNNGFILKDSAEGTGGDFEQKYQSRENSNDPELIVTFI